MALANSGLGLAHGVAAALGAHYSVAHGLACAVMLPTAMKVNRDVALPRVALLGRVMSGRPELDDTGAADLAIETIERICDQLKIPRRLSELGVTSEMLPQLAAASRGNSMDGNPRQLGDEELIHVLTGIL
jgi:alcohol dehydrogenase class IV